jgi:hypothetical protein
MRHHLRPVRVLHQKATPISHAIGLVTDQRGLIRPADLPDISNDPSGDGSDIGAFELQPKPELLFKNGFE